MALALLGTDHDRAIRATVASQHLPVALGECVYTLDGTVAAFPKSSSNAPPWTFVRERSYDARGKWIADDIFSVPSDGSGSADLAHISQVLPAKVDCAVDALSRGENIDALPAHRSTRWYGDLAPCDPHSGVIDDGGPDGNIESVSIGPTWLGVTFYADVNMFFPQAYGKLHDEPYTLYIDDRKMQTLKANGMSERLHFIAPYDPSKPHKIVIGNVGFPKPTDGWTVCLNPVKR